MLLFGHQPHVYEVRRLCRYQITEGGLTEVPDEVGQLLLSEHPAKVCDVSSELEPLAHVCPKSQGYQHEDIEQSPEDRMMRPTSRARSRVGANAE